MTLIAAISLSVPGEYVPEVSPPWEFSLHAAAFLVLTLAWARVRGGPTASVVCAMGALALGSEVLQHTVIPLRSGSLDDALANLAGVLLGAVVARVVLQRPVVPPEPSPPPH